MTHRVEEIRDRPFLAVHGCLHVQDDRPPDDVDRLGGRTVLAQERGGRLGSVHLEAVACSDGIGQSDVVKDARHPEGSVVDVDRVASCEPGCPTRTIESCDSRGTPATE